MRIALTVLEEGEKSGVDSMATQKKRRGRTT